MRAPDGVVCPVLVGCLLLSLPAVSVHAQSQRPTRASVKTLQNTAALEHEYRKWLNEDVRYLITDAERAKFMRLSSVQERDAFVADFWDRRNPAGALANAFREEHYRRLAYANNHFAAGVAGYLTDRGRSYIVYGPPDSVESDFGRQAAYETWHYLYLEGVGPNVTLSFTDSCRCGAYELSGFDSDGREIFDYHRIN
jgi:GWxTD domain-containing protein